MTDLNPVREGIEALWYYIEHPYASLPPNLQHDTLDAVLDSHEKQDAERDGELAKLEAELVRANRDWAIENRRADKLELELTRMKETWYPPTDEIDGGHAAPDLLAALREIERDRLHNSTYLRRIARAALAQAEENQP